MSPQSYISSLLPTPSYQHHAPPPHTDRLYLCDQVTGLCTKHCPLRPTCKRPRISLLVYGIVLDNKNKIQYKHEYINMLAYARSDLLTPAETSMTHSLTKLTNQRI